ncbi:NAD(P)-binding domain-containing protein [Roseomonas sp. OT10]|uniref:ketopantoate reductase family protein n=1 Tax=Roseomonas cutis TaxID=2897332 RepID=UPI001E4164E3|nr:2-dehydropantoate 2-reductase N-terminal domain-containing protein [Roseomonas sp. OT10]UFN48153.1 NAD(P)-binding domain-containing protein [Roseomonas sp. OT10]
MAGDGDRRILIWGAGAIGGAIGAALVRDGFDVTFVDIVPEHVAAIRDPARGLRISGPVAEYSVTAPAFLPEEVQGVWDRVFLAVKAHHTEAACRALLPHLSADGYVLSLQNGLCEPIIASVVGPERTMGAFVNFGADWIEPGHVMLGNRGAVVLGEIDGRMTPRLEALHAVLQHFEPDAITTPEINAFLWGKLGYGALLFATALGEKGIADGLARPELAAAYRRIGEEAVSVALAEGIKPRGFNGFDPEAFRPGAPMEQTRQSIDAMVAFNSTSAKTHSGIWRDLAVRKRRTEVDVQVGTAIEAGRRHGIACPALTRLAEMIHEIEDGRRPLSDDNLLELPR